MKSHWIDKFLPPMKCDNGCGDCCGVAPCSEKEYRAAIAYAAAHNVTPVKQGSTCPFYQGGQCAIWEARPGICRLFGHSPNLRCTRGFNVNIHQASEIATMVRLYEEIGPRGGRLLHEASYEMDELLDVIRTELVGATPITIDGRVVARKPDNKTYHAAKALGEMGLFPGLTCIGEEDMPLE